MFTTVSRQFQSSAKGNQLRRHAGEAKVKIISIKSMLGHGRAFALAAVAILTVLMAGAATAQNSVQQIPTQRQPQQQVMYRDSDGRHWFHDGRKWLYHDGRGWQTCQSPMAVPNPRCGPSGQLTPVQPSPSAARYQRDANGNTWYFNGSSWWLWTTSGWRLWTASGLQPPPPPGVR